MLWTVQIVGVPELATNYFFEIEVFKPGQPWRRYLMSEICQPDIDVEYLYKNSGMCVQSTAAAIDHFITDDKLLIYYLRVKQMSSSIDSSIPKLLDLNLDDDDARSVCSETSERRSHRGGQRKFYKKRGGASRQN